MLGLGATVGILRLVRSGRCDRDQPFSLGASERPRNVRWNIPGLSGRHGGYGKGMYLGCDRSPETPRRVKDLNPALSLFGFSSLFAPSFPLSLSCGPYRTDRGTGGRRSERTVRAPSDGPSVMVGFSQAIELCYLFFPSAMATGHDCVRGVGTAPLDPQPGPKRVPPLARPPRPAIKPAFGSARPLAHENVGTTWEALVRDRISRRGVVAYQQNIMPPPRAHKMAAQPTWFALLSGTNGEIRIKNVGTDKAADARRSEQKKKKPTCTAYLLAPRVG